MFNYNIIILRLFRHIIKHLRILLKHINSPQMLIQSKLNSSQQYILNMSNDN